jgi:7-cyano-7-deazaguanine synthase
MTRTNRAVCMFSGGPDAVVAAELTRRAGYELHTLFIDYGQHAVNRERRCAHESSRWLNAASHTEVAFPAYSLLRAAPMVNDGEISDSANPMSEYVPFRNSVMISMGVVLAETIDADTIVIGSMAGPWVTPDNSPAYYEALGRLIAQGTPDGTDITVSVPLQEYKKAKVIEVGIELGVPYELTWSCHNADDVPCMRCGNCRMRAHAFEAVGATDPLTRTVDVVTG